MTSYLPAVFLSLCLTVPALAGPSAVSLKVVVSSENQKADKKSAEETRARWLTVRVTNTSAEAMEGLSLKWTLYAAVLQKGANDIVVEKSGEEKFSVEAKGRYTDITTAKVPFTWTPAHSEKSGKKSKKVPESGHHYYGYTVQVLKDGEVVGEALSSQAMRKHME